MKSASLRYLPSMATAQDAARCFANRVRVIHLSCFDIIEGCISLHPPSWRCDEELDTCCDCWKKVSVVTWLYYIKTVHALSMWQ